MKLHGFLAIISQNKAAAAALAVVFSSVVGGGFYAGTSAGQNTIQQFVRPESQASEQAVSTQTSQPRILIAQAANQDVESVQTVPERFRIVYTMYPSIFTRLDGTLVFETETTAAPIVVTTINETSAPQETAAPQQTSAPQETAATETTQAETQVEAKKKKTTTAATTAAPAATTVAPVETTAAPAATTAAPVAGAGTFNADMARAILDLVNEQRAAAGLPALTWNGTLAASAEIRATEIVVKWSHTRPDGSAWYTAGSQMEMGENLAYGQSSTTQVMTEWMASPGHAENILRSTFTQMGVSCYIVNGTYYWAQHFA